MSIKLGTNEQGDLLIEDAYSGIELRSQGGESLGICLRDSGFEFNYQGTWYEAKNGVLKKMGNSDQGTKSKTESCQSIST